MIRVAVVGAAGYAGVEAVRWVLSHPGLSLAAATSGADEGKAVAELYPVLAGFTDVRFSAPEPDSIAASCDVALLAVPHTAALSVVPRLLDLGVTVVDLSADFRLRDQVQYEHWYDAEHLAPELLKEAVYGLPESHRSKLPGARLVACPGCYPTATVLAALPALESGVVVGPRVVVDAKSGVSGAGRGATATTHFCSANESMMPYKVGLHRHTPEMEQALADVSGREMSVIFTPHLVPMSRGLLSTVYMDVEDGLSTSQAVELYRGRYHAEPFVHVHPEGKMPSTSEVRGTNGASVGVYVDERTNTLVAACAIDNLGKGSASQGIQCINAIFGMPEIEGLLAPGPVV